MAISYVKEFFDKKEKVPNDINEKMFEYLREYIVIGCMPNVVIRSPHFASFHTRNNVIPSVLPSGKPCYSKVAIYENYSQESVFLHHYMTKSLSEFVKQKMNRNDADYNQQIKLDYFWRINTKTPQKIEWLKEMGLL